MAAGAWVSYDTGKLDFFDEDFTPDNHYWTLHTSSYTPATTHVTFSQITNECADGDYAKQDATGEATSNSSGTITVDIGDVDFGNTVTITAKYLVLVRGTVAGSAGTDRVVGYCDLNSGGGSVSSTSGNFDITINASGIVTAT